MTRAFMLGLLLGCFLGFAAYRLTAGNVWAAFWLAAIGFGLTNAASRLPGKDEARPPVAPEPRPAVTYDYARGFNDAVAHRAIDPPKGATRRAEYMRGFEDARR